MNEKQYSPAMVQFIDTVLQEKGVEGVDEDIKKQLRFDLLGRLEDRINQAIIDALSPTQLAKFEQLIDNNQIDGLDAFLEKQGIAVPVIVARCMVNFRAEYLGA